jgi:hypothetical protein
MTYTATTLGSRVSLENYIETTLKLDITSYTTGGEDLSDDLAVTMPNSVVGMVSCVSNESGKFGCPVFDLDNQKLMFYDLVDGSQEGSTDDMGVWIATFRGW